MKTHTINNDSIKEVAIIAARTAKAIGYAFQFSIEYTQWITGKPIESAYQRLMKLEYNKDKQNVLVVDRVKLILFSKFPDLRYNTAIRNIELHNTEISNTELNDIYIKVLEQGERVTKDLVFTLLSSDWLPKYNPFDEFFKTFNSKPPQSPYGHIDALIKCITTDTPNADIFMKKWLVSIVASIYGTHSPLLLVLCGKQNTGKTYFFRHLLPKAFIKYYADNELDSSKDSDILMTKKLIICDDEFGGKNKQEIKKLKALISKQFFNVRPPYGRISEDLPRLAVLCGTTNDEQILNDPTGNRRILPINVLSIDHNAYNSVNKDYLFYECYLEYRRGYNYKLNTSDIEMLNRSSIVFKAISLEEELIQKYFVVPEGHIQNLSPKELTPSEIMIIIKKETGESINFQRLGVALKALGFKQKVKKVGGGTVRLYEVITLPA